MIELGITEWVLIGLFYSFLLVALVLLFAIWRAVLARSFVQRENSTFLQRATAALSTLDKKLSNLDRSTEQNSQRVKENTVAAREQSIRIKELSGVLGAKAKMEENGRK